MPCAEAENPTQKGTSVDSNNTRLSIYPCLDETAGPNQTASAKFADPTSVNMWNSS